MLKNQTQTRSLNNRISIGLFIMIILGLSNLVQAQSYVTVTTTSGAHLVTGHDKVTPFSTKKTGGLHQYLITATELTNNYNATPGYWDGLGFDVVAIPTIAGIDGLTIKIKTTSVNQIPLAPVTGATTLFSSTTTEYPTVGWNIFDFSAPFYWNGTDNIIVQVCYANTISSATNYTVSRNYAGTKTLGVTSNTSPGCGLTNTTTRHVHRPNMRFRIYNPSVDARVSKIVSPELRKCALDTIVKVEIENKGTDTLRNVVVNWTVNGMAQPSFTYTGAIAYQDVDTVNLGAYSNGFNENDTIKAWTVVANDSNLLNDTTQTRLFTSLNGNYTIDTSGVGDFISFTDAINTLTQRGVCGPVTITALDSLYEEQITIGAIKGASLVNTITFTSQNGNPLSVRLKHTSTSSSNWTIKFKNARNINFTGLGLANNGGSYSRVIISNGINDNSRHISFDSCLFFGGAHNSGSTNKAIVYLSSKNIHHWKFTNSTFKRGSYHIYIYGYSTSYSNNFKILNNTFINSFTSSLDASYADFIEYKENNITSNSSSTTAKAIDLNYCRNGEITNNHIIGKTNWPRYGVYMYRCNGDLGNPLKIYNNRFHIEAGRYGIYNSGSEFLDIANNSILVEGATGRAIYMTAGAYNWVRNNILQVTNTGYAIKSDLASIYQMNRNALSAPNGILANDGSDRVTLADWQNATGFDSNSVVVDSIFSDSITLIVCNDSLYAKGVSITSLTTDFEGQPRQNIPCLGADEFQPANTIDFSNLGTLCEGDTMELSQFYFDTILWDNNHSGNFYQFWNTGSHTISVSGQCGSTQHSFNVGQQDFVQINDTNICSTNPYIASTNVSNAIYTWNNGSQDSSITIDTAQTIYIEVIDQFGCYSTDSAIIQFSAPVNLPDSVSFCEKEFITLQPTALGQYLWNDGTTGTTYSATTPGQVYVTVTNFNCVSSDTAYITEILLPVANFKDSADAFTVEFTNLSTNATSYTWHFGDGDSSNYEHPVHLYPYTAAEDTITTVTLIARNQCGEDTKYNTNVTYGRLVGISEFSFASEVNIYPNPSSGTFTVSVLSDLYQDGQLQIFDTHGKQVFSQQIQTVPGNNSFPIELEVAKGIYFVKTSINNQFATYRIVVE